MPCVAGGALPGVRLGDHADEPRTALRPVLQQREGPVAGAVVDRDHLDPVEVEVLLLDGLDEVRQEPLYAVDGGDHREERAVGAGGLHGREHMQTPWCDRA